MYMLWVILLLQINASFLKQLVDKIRSDSQGLEEGGEQVVKHFENTLEHIQEVRSTGNFEGYNDMVLWWQGLPRSKWPLVLWCVWHNVL